MQSHSFTDLGLSASLITAVAAEGYTTPTEIQAQAIPVLASGANVLATAQTGTGKTAAFTLPLIHQLITAGVRSSRPERGAHGPARPRALILAPTRELAIQIDQSIAVYGRGSGISHLAVFGGAPKGRQLQNLRTNPVVLVATPGRLQDFIGDNAISLSAVEYLILDEADRMLDMGFIPEVRRIAKMAENRKQTALFSATMPDEIEKLAKEILGKATRIAIAPKAMTADGIRQTVLHVSQEDKIKLLPELIKDRNMFRVLVFTRTKHRAARVAKVLLKAGIPSDEIHGNRSQNQRQRALESFRRGKVQVLVGTDVAARGIDVDDITHVINFEIPNEPETYVHRIGRTARAGSAGEAISMCDTQEAGDFRRIEQMLKYTVDIDRNHQFHLEIRPVAAPRRSGAPGGGPSRSGGGRSSSGRSGSYRGNSAGSSPDRRGQRGGFAAARPGR